jgi:hypothetical protein
MSAAWGLIIAFGSIAVITVLIVILAVKSSKNTKKRELAIELLAEEMGWMSEKNWKYSGLGAGFGDDLHKNFPYFKNSPAVISKNLVQGEINGATFRIFDCGTKFGRDFSFKTTVFVESNSLNLPSFSLSPEKFGGIFGGQDIDFETHPEFSKSYLLKSDDENLIRRLFDNSVLNFYGQNPGLTVLGNANQLLFFRGNDFELTPPQFKKLLDEALKTLHVFEAASRRINH